MDLVVVSHYANALTGLGRAARRFDEVLPGWGRLLLVDCSSAPDEERAALLAERLGTADCLLVDLMGSDQRWVELVGDALEHFRGDVVPTGAHFTTHARLGGRTQIGRAHV